MTNDRVRLEVCFALLVMTACAAVSNSGEGQGPPDLGSGGQTTGRDARRRGAAEDAGSSDIAMRFGDTAAWEAGAVPDAAAWPAEVSNPTPPSTPPLPDMTGAVYESLPAGALQVADVILEKGHPAGRDLRMMVTRVGDTPVSVAFENEQIRYREWDGVTLTWQANKLAGKQRIWESDGSAGNDYALEVALTIGADGAIQGTYKLLRSRAVTPSTGAFLVLRDLEGVARGRVVTEEALKARHGMPAQGLWPSYLGPRQNFSGGSLGVPMTDDPTKAPLVWRSEFLGGFEIADCRHGLRLWQPRVAGGASPLLAGGRIFQAHLRPTGTQIQKCFSDNWADRHTAWAMNVGLSKERALEPYAIEADEFVSAIDAATGRTLWRTRFPRQGINLVAHKSGLTNHTGAYGDGRVYAFGSLGVVRALDAATGRVLWSTPVPGYHERMMKFRADALTSGNFSVPDRAFNHGLNYVSGVVIAPSGVERSGLVGIDGVTGEILWKGGTLGSRATPLKWTHAGKEYVVTADEAGTIMAIDPADGKVLWTIAQGGNNYFQFVLEGDVLVAAAGAFRLSLTGAQMLWPLGCPPPNSKHLGMIQDEVAWLRCDDALVARKLSTGQELRRDPALAAVAEAFSFGMEGMLLLDTEVQHRAAYGLRLFASSPGSWAQLGSRWRPPHPIDLAYTVPQSPVAIAGRVFMRGQDGLYAYDLRR